MIAAAGRSSRMGGIKKEYRPLSTGITVLGAAAAAFAACQRIGPLVIAVPEGDEDAARSALPPDLRERKNLYFVGGGESRRASVYKALIFLEKLDPLPSWVLIHDGARPWIKKELIGKIMDAAMEYRAVIPVLPLVETPKEICFQDNLGYICRHLRRQNLGTAQTPQGFAFPEILRAHEKAAERELGEKFEYTDDAEVWGEFIGKVSIISGDPDNRKITFPEDLGDL